MNEAEKIRLVGLIQGKNPNNGMEKHFLKVMAGLARAVTPQEKEWVNWAIHYKNKKLFTLADPNLKNSINPKIQIKEKALTTDENWRMKKAIELADKQLNKKIRKTSKSITTGWTTLDQGNNRLGDNIIKKRYVDEGIAGTREENKGMRTNQSRDMLKRNKGIS